MKIEIKNLLLSDRLAPITSKMGFLDIDFDIACKEFLAWQNEIKSSWDVTVSSRRVTGDLESVLKKLLPLRMVSINRYLLIPTASNWVAYFDNGYRGTDPSPIGYLAERMECRSLWAVVKPHTLQKTGVPRRGRQGALILELYGSEQREWLNLIREIRLYTDAGKWEFCQSGIPLPFENTNQYEEKRVSKRFSFESFMNYLDALGIKLNDEQFYLTSDGHYATLVELRGKLFKFPDNMSLKRARRLNGIEDGLRIGGKLISRRGYF